MPRDAWTLVGSTTGKRFQVKFLQNPLSSARLVVECLAALKDENGIWKNIQVALVNHQTEKLHIGKDESPKTALQRTMAKCLQKAMGEFYGHIEEVHYRPRKCSVFAGSVGVASMQPAAPNPDRNSFLWNATGVEKLGLDKERLIAKTLALLASPEDQIQWSL